uniref:Ubiquitin-like-conjugating enzyme ATG10 n=1 Tax=Ditylenchus dipsaci TaxID=166011 RepID=A0A915DKL3_9BILA
MISESQFVKDIEEFCALASRFETEDTWTVKKARGGSAYLDCHSSVVNISSNGTQAKRSLNICYSATYNVPVIWFNFYNTDGKLLLFDDFKGFLLENVRNSMLGERLLEGISQNEHPHFGISFYNIHPCKNAELMKELKANNYILSFLSTTGGFIGLNNWPLEMFLNESDN